MCSRRQAAGGPGSTSEATLFRQAQAGCRDSLNLLMARHEGLVHAVVRRYGFGELAFTEAVHLGRIGLWRAVLHYTPERGLAFSTYAWPCIRNEILHVTRARARRKALPFVSLVALSDQVLDALLEQETQWIRQSMLQLVARLPERLRYVIVGVLWAARATCFHLRRDWHAAGADQAAGLPTPHRSVSLVTPARPLADFTQSAQPAHRGGLPMGR